MRTAEEGHKRATRAMNVAGDWIVQMEDSLQQVGLKIVGTISNLENLDSRWMKLKFKAKEGVHKTSYFVQTSYEFLKGFLRSLF